MCSACFRPKAEPTVYTYNIASLCICILDWYIVFNLLKSDIFVYLNGSLFSNKWMEHGLVGTTGTRVPSRVAVGHERVRDHVIILLRPMAVICVLVHLRKHQRVTWVHVQVRRKDTPQLWDTVLCLCAYRYTNFLCNVYDYVSKTSLQSSTWNNQFSHINSCARR